MIIILRSTDQHPLLRNLVAMCLLLSYGAVFAQAMDDLTYKDERHISNIKQLTFGGQNAEAYFSADGKELIFQSTRDSLQCDGIFRMKSDGTNVRKISSGKGVTTCSFIAPDNKSIIYSSTHLGGDACPPKPDYSRGYVWSLYKDFDIFKLFIADWKP